MSGVIELPEIKALSENILRIRHQMGESQIEFAENCGISIFTISKIEYGTGNPRLETLQRIAAYTGKTVYNLLKVHDDA